MATRIKFHPAAFRELLNSPGVVADIDRRAQAIATAANAEGTHVVDSATTRSGQRHRAAVITADFEAMRAEAKTRNLTRAIDAGRG